METRIGELIEASTATFVAQSYELHRGPDFGQLVKAIDGERVVYALVYDVRTASIDPNRRAIARGGGGVFDAAIYEHPELRETLRTEFAAVIVGHRNGDKTWQHLPAKPPPLHYSVHACDEVETATFNDCLDYLAGLLDGTAHPADELVAASIRRAYAARGGDREFLLRAGRTLAMLLKDDYPRLAAILRRIQL